MLSSGMFSALAASMAVRSRALPPGSPPPCLAAMVISRISLVKSAPRRWSVTAFFRLIRSEERRVGKECQLVTGVQTCALPISSRIPAALFGGDGDFTDQLGEECPAPLVGDGLLPLDQIGRASCRERVSIGDWSSDVCSSDLLQDPRRPVWRRW